jgi:uncharacterized membrane protein
VKTGFPFGRYVYTQTLGISLLDVPLAIACAWMVPFAFVRQVAPQPLAAAVLLTATDLPIDPVASGVPLTNFAGWFLVSLLIFAWPRKPVTRNLSQRVLGVTILLVFAILATERWRSEIVISYPPCLNLLNRASTINSTGCRR